MEKLDKGLCENLTLRFYFDGEGCREFYYYGSNGNENNFVSLEKCQETCEIPSIHPAGVDKAINDSSKKKKRALGGKLTLPSLTERRRRQSPKGEYSPSAM